jgi:hypothetical protein
LRQEISSRKGKRSRFELVTVSSRGVRVVENRFDHVDRVPEGRCALRSCSIEAIMRRNRLERLFAGARHLNSSNFLVWFAISLCDGQHPTSDGLTTLNFLAPASYSSCTYVVFQLF